MSSVNLPEDCSQQWELLLLLLSSEEKKIDRTSDSEIEVMNYFYNNEGIRKILEQWLQQMHSSYAEKPTATDTAVKSEDIAALWRQKGNEHFRNNSIEESYKCYTKSVLYAEPEGKNFPLALANRSATLLHMKKFEECLTDIDLALENNHELKHKLYLRKADCYAELNQLSKAQVAFDNAWKIYRENSLPPNQVSEFERHSKHVSKKLAKISSNAKQETEGVNIPSLLNGENDNFVSASAALELRRSESVGRHVVCRESARRGDVLFSEEPYAFVALPLDGDLPVVCENCCRGDLNPVPCKICSRAVYCGETCRAAAWLAHHRWECVAARSRLFPTIGIAHLALRVLLVSAHNGFPSRDWPADAADKLTAGDVFRAYSDVDNLEIYSKEVPPFYRMFNLVTNFDKMNNADFVQYALTATMLTLYLERHTSFLESSEAGSRWPPLAASQRRLFAAALLLRALGQLVANGHAALSLLADDGEDGLTVSEREVRHATAIYPSAAMMNHSCDPNIINTFYRSRLIIRCSRELSGGAVVYNCYGPHRAREPAADRRAALRAQYHFLCACDACTDEQKKDFVLLFSAYLCQVCKGAVTRGRCAQCRAELDVTRAALATRNADELLAQAELSTTLEGRLERVSGALRLRQAVCHRHHADLRRAADALARLHAEMGDFTKSIELIKQNIQSLEYQYGSFSVEVAHDLKKLADVMLQRIIRLPHHADYREWCLETHKIIKKAVQLMELNYGGWDSVSRRLRAQEAAVAAAVTAAAAAARAPGPASVHHSMHYNLKI